MGARSRAFRPIWVLAFTLVIATAATTTARGPVLPAPAPWEPELPHAAIETPDQFGLASWYGEFHHGRETATGEPFDQWALTAAHPTLPLGSHVDVTNVGTGQRVRVRVNDRGPYVGGRVLDLSRAAAGRIGAIGAGIVRVRIRVVDSTPKVSAAAARTR